MSPRQIVCPLVLLCLLLSQRLLAEAQKAPLQGFDDYVRRAMAEWQVPGVAIAIVKHDALVLAKGYGVRQVDDTRPVTKNTSFAIGSATKAFTAASLAMLVDEGKLRWDALVTQYLRGFQLSDPYVTRELTVRDLLTHRSGLERADLLWYGSAYDRDEVLRRVRYIKPTWSFRSRFGYQNIMYLAAGQIIPAVTGDSWENFVRQRIFMPLGMTASQTSVTALAGADDVATPHAWLDGRVRAIPLRNLDNIGPACSIISNVVDMAQWVQLHLGGGAHQRARLFSAEAAKEMSMPHTLMRLEPPWSELHPEAHFLAYGLGWFLSDYWGRKLVLHGGNIAGMTALVALVPEERLGLVILTNMHQTLLTYALIYRVVDAYLGQSPRDWNREFLKVARERREQTAAAQRKLEEERKPGTKPSLPLQQYTGAYTHDAYGAATVQEQGGKLILQYGLGFIGDLEHWHQDTFQALWRDRLQGKAQVTFTLNAQRKVDAMKVTIWNIQNLVFKRAPETAEKITSVLAQGVMFHVTEISQ
jgi:CubicO group peptidase (beta-lactamase class C family)